MLVTQRKQSHIIAVVTVSTSGRSATSPTGAFIVITAGAAVWERDDGPPPRGRQCKLASTRVGCVECRKGGQRAPETSASATLFAGVPIREVSSAEINRVEVVHGLTHRFVGRPRTLLGSIRSERGSLGDRDSLQSKVAPDTEGVKGCRRPPKRA